MENLITHENLRLFAYTNEEALNEMPAKGIVVEFMGLGNTTMFPEPHPMAESLAKQGVILMVPFLNPWNWMNETAAKQTDLLIDVLKSQYGNLPIVSTGGSMGGLCSIVYSAASAHHPIACVANCPVCDLPAHYHERPDLPRTLWSAFGLQREKTIEDAMKDASPLHLSEAGRLPDIPYIVFHCTEDRSVNKQLHSDKFVSSMRKYRDVRYVEVEGRGHCDLPDDIKERYWSYITGFLRDEIAKEASICM